MNTQFNSRKSEFEIKEKSIDFLTFVENLNWLFSISCPTLDLVPRTQLMLQNEASPRPLYFRSLPAVLLTNFAASPIFRSLPASPIFSPLFCRIFHTLFFYASSRIILFCTQKIQVFWEESTCFKKENRPREASEPKSQRVLLTNFFKIPI